MARRRKDHSPSGVKLKQPDRTGPSEKTLLELAEQRGLFNQAQEREERIKAKTKTAPPEASAEDAEPLPPVVERILETLLWTVSLAALHFTLDVLVQNQYAAELSWPKVVGRAGQAFLGMLRPSLYVGYRWKRDLSTNVPLQCSASCSTPFMATPRIRPSCLAFRPATSRSSDRAYSS